MSSAKLKIVVEDRALVAKRETALEAIARFQKAETELRAAKDEHASALKSLNVALKEAEWPMMVVSHESS